MAQAVLGIIGGSGIYDLPGLQDKREEKITSAWGAPSAALKRGRIGDTQLVFLPRHGEGHRLSPSDINYRANIDVLKQAGVTDLISLSACGSFREHLPPGSIVLVDQFIDRTVKRESSFFGAGCVAHVPRFPGSRSAKCFRGQTHGLGMARQLPSLRQQLSDTTTIHDVALVGAPSGWPPAKLPKRLRYGHESV